MPNKLTDIHLAELTPQDFPRRKAPEAREKCQALLICYLSRLPSNKQITKAWHYSPLFPRLGGFVGSTEYRGELAEFHSLLRLGARLHVGKGTGFGLGKYEVA
jgi:transposase